MSVTFLAMQDDQAKVFIGYRPSETNGAEDPKLLRYSLPLRGAG